jgi:uncharacterized membrane protein (TIGR02234 family)
MAGVCAALVLAAAGLWAGSRLAWFTAAVDAPGRGRVAVRATGAEVAPALTGLALLALAAVPAAVALAGPLRRGLGVLLTAAGAWAWTVVVRLLHPPPTAAELAALPGAPATGTPVPDSVTAGVGPLPAALGALLLTGAGVVLLVRERRLPRFGARSRAAAADPDRAAWEALDAGVDPTVEPTDGGPAKRAD